jgi:hypothetical protein
MHSTPRFALALASALSLTSCARSTTETSPGERPSPSYITAAEIAHSGTTNAWDLLRVRARGYDFNEDRYGRPRSIKSRRGRSSVSLPYADTPLILIDGARIIDLVTLRDLSTQSIASIELLSGIEGTAKEGTNASAGVIYIHTWEASSAQRTDTGRIIARKNEDGR